MAEDERDRQDVTPPQDSGDPDQVESDPASLNSAEYVDEDRLGENPLTGAMAPPDDWSEADAYGTTPREQKEGETLDDRLEQEEPDIQPGESPP
ncbi:hypothetical protein [Lolliginicoccus suaedae]|uniref:hypothetical protein n=1 Tax=Lolliginicoccus suaedae TaxID=2605429 RepID=UPI0011EDDB4C|nr:hypothetical protein [Lolliginicoccus suaedae]